jgi:RNA polymerase sigma-70 factor (ECF subfamily)
VKYQRRAAAEIRRVVHDPAVTEELTQDAFLRAYDGLAELQARDRFWPWLRRICRNVASSYLRSGQNRLDDRPADPDAESTVAALERHAAHGSVEDELAARQLFEALRGAVAALPERQRDAILMREIEGLDYRSIAATMGLPVNTVKSLIFRGRDAIARTIRPLLQPTRSRRW